ncbi:hypothetical protein ACQCU1_18980 [Sutcliffiella horikoshii]|uniref:hypothetical protein n=1 Tax=Sutcliffiella horikoshii TaxID=79883 RepID=UPI003CF352BF
MENLDINQLENLIGDKIFRRETIDNSKLNRIIEKVETTNREVLIKYGIDEDLLKEINIYEKVLNKSKAHPVPKLIVSGNFDGINILGLEWIEGIHPDFTKKNHIEKVFIALGKWAAEWSNQIKSDQLYASINNFGDLTNLLEKNKRNLTPILGDSLMDLLTSCIEQSEEIINNIEKMPKTLNPGDISLHNFIIDNNEKIIFIDFESCTVNPMITLVEHLGEDYGSLPNTKNNVHFALKSYLNSWNKYSAMHIEWDDFIRCQLCARVNYKIGYFNYWIKRILENKNIEETLEWVRQGQKQLELILKSPDFRK